VDVVKINTNLVQIDAVVTRNGKHVTDLNAEDFVVLQDGKPQTITNFSYIWNVPPRTENVAAAPGKTKDRVMVPTVPGAIKPYEPHRTMAFVVDDLGLSFDTIDRVRKQLRKFINEQMLPTDLVAIIRTGGETGILQQFTSDRRLLLNAVDQIKWNLCSRTGVSFFEPAPSENQRPCTDTYSLTLNSLRFIVGGMGHLPGRKSLALFSDMMPVDINASGPTPPSARLSPGGAAATAVSSASDESSGSISSNYALALQRIAEYAIRSSVVIYAVDTRGLVDTFPSAAIRFGSSGAWSPTPARGPGSPSRQVGAMMSGYSKRLFEERQASGMIAQETGGRFFYNSNGFHITDIVEDQQGYYLIGFRPTGETFNRSFHHITIKLKPKGLAVRTRAGFYGVTNEEARRRQQAPLSDVNAMLASPFGINDITVRLNPLFANISNRGSVLRSFIYVNARDLSFTVGSNGVHDAAFDVDSILFGDNGRPVYQRSQTASLQLNEEQYQRTLREGVVYDFELPVIKPGTFQFRVAVRDHDSAKVGTAAQVVEVPNLATNVLTLSGLVVTPEIAGAETAPANGETDQFVLPGARTFRRGTTVMFGYAIYNGQLDKSGARQPELTAQTRIFRDGKLVYTGEPASLSLTGQSDLQRITAGGRLQLGADFPVGEYVLQIVITDNSNKVKPRIATQWIDFEVVK
jgi:VWFA-related protein